MQKPNNVSNALWEAAQKRAARYCAKYMVEGEAAGYNYNDAMESVSRSLRADMTSPKKVKKSKNKAQG